MAQEILQQTEQLGEVEEEKAFKSKQQNYQ